MANVTSNSTGGEHSGRPHLDSFLEYRISTKIWKYVSPVIILTGTITSFLAICVLARKSLKHSSSMYFLTILAISDIFVLNTGLLRHWILHIYDTDVRTNSKAGCKIHVFFVYVSLDIASWVLVAVTFDRCIVVRWPFKGRSYATKQNAIKVTVIIILLAAFINCHLLWNASLVNNICTVTNDFSKFAWPWIDLFKNSFIPFLLILITNSLIIHQIVRANRRVMAQQTREPRVRFISGGSDITDGGHVFRQAAKRPRVPSISAMLLSISLAFFVLTSPVVIYHIGRSTLDTDIPLEEIVKWDLFRTIANILQYTNNAIHFFLYRMSGPRFRKELKAMLKCQKTNVVSEQSTMVL